jgi:hypothetical protein
MAHCSAFGKACRQCCVGRSLRITERSGGDDRLSDGHRELVECHVDAVAGGDVGGEFVVTASEVLDEDVPGGQDPRGPVAFESAHRPQPGLQPAMVGLDRVVGVPLDSVQSRRDQLIQDPRISRGAVGGDLGRNRPGAEHPGEEPPGCGQVPPDGEQDVDDLAVLVNSPVEVGPPAGDLDIRFVGEPPVTRSMPAEPRRLDELRG